MIKINLVSKKSRAYKGKNWTKTIAVGIFGLFCLYFLGVTFYVVISMSLIAAQISKVNAESEAVSGLMLANNDKLSRFVLTKLILTKIGEINKQRFRYKDYLDQVSILLPGGSVLSSVGFATRGWITVSISSENVSAFGVLEKSLLNKNSWTGNKYFSGAYIEDITKEKTGFYTTRLQLELRK